MSPVTVSKLQLAGIDIGIFAAQVAAALAAAKNPSYAPLIQQAGTIITAHLSDVAIAVAQTPAPAPALGTPPAIVAK